MIVTNIIASHLAPQVLILVSFLKRAQILVSDLYGCFKGTGDLADFTNISYV